MKKIIRLTESDLMRLVEKVLEEQNVVAVGKVFKFRNPKKSSDTVYSTKVEKKISDTEFESGGYKFVIGGNALYKIDPKTKQQTIFSIVESIGMVSEQKVEDEKVALEKFNKMISEVKSGFCKPWYSSGYQFQVKCNDGSKYQINQFR